MPSFPFYTGLALLGLAMGAQFLLRSHLLRVARVLVYAAATLMLGYAFYVSYLQYILWQAHPFSRYLLPPYQGPGYFWEYVFSRYIGAWILALVFAVIFGLVSHALNRRFGERFFEKEEPWLFALGAFLAGYPGFLFYLGSLLLFALLLSAFYSLRGMGRAPLYYLWLSTAVFAILIVQFLVPRDILVQFNL